MLVGLEDDENAVFSVKSKHESTSDFLGVKLLARLLKALDRFNSYAALDEDSELKSFRSVIKTNPEGDDDTCILSIPTNCYIVFLPYQLSKLNRQHFGTCHNLIPPRRHLLNVVQLQ